VKDVVGLYSVVYEEVFPLDGLDEWRGDRIDGVRHLPNVIVSLFALLHTDG
jgi:hypothetical protein